MPAPANIQAQVLSLITEGISVNCGYNCRVEKKDGQITNRVRPLPLSWVCINALGGQQDGVRPAVVCGRLQRQLRGDPQPHPGRGAGQGVHVQLDAEDDGHCDPVRRRVLQAPRQRRI